ncbi:MAG TPA: dienelactone hydrolase family protein [Candidatus Baltobacteraceae bacterium]|jgi:carboxymethylenebutenolidase
MVPSVRSVILALAIAVSVAPPPVSAAQTEITVGVRKSMHATLVAPDGPGPYPGVLVLHTSGGLEDADLAFATRLAGEGYVCLVPAFMAAYGLSAQSRDEAFTRDGDAIYADLVSALDTLQNNPKVQGSKIAAIGFSAGGYFAVWLALTNKVQAAVGYYGAYSGAGTDKELTHFERLANASSAPILILHGSDDRTVPVHAALRLASILENVKTPYQIKIYPNAGHLFDRADAARPAGGYMRSGRGPARGGTDAGDSDANIDAWTRTMDFLRTYVSAR